MFTPQMASALRALAGWNWHVHTIFSDCAAPEMTPEHVLAEADRLGLRGIALVDHHHPGDGGMARRRAALAADVGRIPHRVEVLVGAELSAHGVDRYAETPEDLNGIAFRLYACNHYHIGGWEHPSRRTPEGYKDHSLAMLKCLLPTGRAQCIAHPFLGCYLSGILADPQAMTRLITDGELARLFALARRHNVAWEVSLRHLGDDLPFARRFLAAGFAAGADFRLGTDAHTLAMLDLRPHLERLIEVLL